MLRKLLPAVPPGKLKRAGGRVLVAVSCYLILALTAAFTLDGVLRAAVLFLIALLAFKTLLHAGDGEMD
jgi:hypothetical protein